MTQVTLLLTSSNINVVRLFFLGFKENRPVLMYCRGGKMSMKMSPVSLSRGPQWLSGCYLALRL